MRKSLLTDGAGAANRHAGQAARPPWNSPQNNGDTGLRAGFRIPLETAFHMGRIEAAPKNISPWLSSRHGAQKSKLLSINSLKIANIEALSGGLPI